LPFVNLSNGGNASDNYFPNANTLSSIYPSANTLPNNLIAPDMASGANGVHSDAVPLQFHVPATLATFGVAARRGDVNRTAVQQPRKHKKSASENDSRESAAKKQRTSGTATTAASVSGAPKTRKTRSNKGKTQTNATAARVALENETPEECTARIAVKKAAFLKKKGCVAA
jgi:hypothetical protein